MLSICILEALHQTHDVIAWHGSLFAKAVIAGANRLGWLILRQILGDISDVQNYLEESPMVKFPSVSAMVLTSLLFSATSQAVTTTYTTESSFPAALPGPATTTTPTSRAPSTVNNDIELVTGAGSASNGDVVDVMCGDGRTGYVTAQPFDLLLLVGLGGHPVMQR
jgi:hypothetical protein